MHDLIGFLRRVVVVCGIVLGTGAMSCTRIEDGIRFAPGYGYVIEVVEEIKGGKSETSYFVFDTEAEAAKWAFNFQQTPSKPYAMQAPGYRLRVDDDRDKELFKKISEALKTASTPPSASDTIRAIDQVVPPIPTAPAPQ
jgi:hypothetical protein